MRIFLNSTFLLAPIPFSWWRFILSLYQFLFHHYKELSECISELERIEMKVYTKNKGLTIKEEEKEVPTTIHSCYFLDNVKLQFFCTIV
jgi:hypothetical protein